VRAPGSRQTRFAGHRKGERGLSGATGAVRIAMLPATNQRSTNQEVNMSTTATDVVLEPAAQEFAGGIYA